MNPNHLRRERVGVVSPITSDVIVSSQQTGTYDTHTNTVHSVPTLAIDMLVKLIATYNFI